MTINLGPISLMSYGHFFVDCVEESTCQLPRACPRIPTTCLNKLALITKVKSSSEGD